MELGNHGRDMKTLQEVNLSSIYLLCQKSQRFSFLLFNIQSRHSVIYKHIKKKSTRKRGGTTPLLPITLAMAPRRLPICIEDETSTTKKGKPPRRIYIKGIFIFVRKKKEKKFLQNILRNIHKLVQFNSMLHQTPRPEIFVII